MSVKPTDLAPWATDATYPAGAEPEAETSNKADPGEEDTVGWRPAKKPPAQKMNGWQNKVHKWIVYLSDAVFQGNTIFTDDVQVKGVITGDPTTHVVFDDTVTFNDPIVADDVTAQDVGAHDVTAHSVVATNGIYDQSSHYTKYGPDKWFDPDAIGTPIQVLGGAFPTENLVARVTSTKRAWLYIDAGPKDIDKITSIWIRGTSAGTAISYNLTKLVAGTTTVVPSTSGGNFVTPHVLVVTVTTPIGIGSGILYIEIGAGIGQTIDLTETQVFMAQT